MQSIPSLALSLPIESNWLSMRNYIDVISNSESNKNHLKFKSMFVFVISAVDWYGLETFKYLYYTPLGIDAHTKIGMFGSRSRAWAQNFSFFGLPKEREKKQQTNK